MQGISWDDLYNCTACLLSCTLALGMSSRLGAPGCRHGMHPLQVVLRLLLSVQCRLLSLLAQLLPAHMRNPLSHMHLLQSASMPLPTLRLTF